MFYGVHQTTIDAVMMTWKGGGQIIIFFTADEDATCVSVCKCVLPSGCKNPSDHLKTTCSLFTYPEGTHETLTYRFSL